MNKSVVTFEHCPVVKTTLEQNKRLAAKFSEKRKLFKVIWGYKFRMYEFNLIN